MFFLDYMALGKNIPEKVATIVAGVAEGCKKANCSLIGGETAEMPGFYPVDEYDLAGFCVGIVDKKKIINKGNQKPQQIETIIRKQRRYLLCRQIHITENSDENSKQHHRVKYRPRRKQRQNSLNQIVLPHTRREIIRESRLSEALGHTQREPLLTMFPFLNVVAASKDRLPRFFI